MLGTYTQYLHKIRELFKIHWGVFILFAYTIRKLVRIWLLVKPTCVHTSSKYYTMRIMSYGTRASNFSDKLVYMRTVSYITVRITKHRSHAPHKSSLTHHVIHILRAMCAKEFHNLSSHPHFYNYVSTRFFFASHSFAMYTRVVSSIYGRTATDLALSLLSLTS